MTLNRTANELGRSHTVENYATPKKNEADLRAMSDMNISPGHAADKRANYKLLTHA